MSIKKYFYSQYWWNLKYNISTFFFPKQRWLTKKIPNHWCDKVELIKLTLFESIVHFVEDEDCFNFTDWEGSSSAHAEAAKKIKHAYDVIKNQIPALEKERDDLYETDKPPRVPFDEMFVKEEGGMSYLRKFTPEETAFYEKLLDIDERKEKLEQETCELIVSVRQFMWT